MDKYLLVLIYKPSLTKEQIEERIVNEINPIFQDYKIDKPKYQYSGNKLFSYIIKKNKCGHYVTFTFSCKTADQKSSITKIQKRINSIQDVIRVMSFFTNNPEQIIDTLTKMDANVDSRELYL